AKIGKQPHSNHWPAMQILLCDSPTHATRWEQFVAAHPDSTNYHRWKWKHVVESVFEWPTFYLAAQEAGEIKGVLPLVSVSGCLGGSSLCSMPFLGDCGILAQNDLAEQKLLEKAISIGNQRRVDYIELRHQKNHRLGLAHKSN